MKQREETYREGFLESRNDVTCSEMLIVPGFKIIIIILLVICYLKSGLVTKTEKFLFIRCSFLGAPDLLGQTRFMGHI